MSRCRKKSRLCVNKLFTSLFWFSYVTGLGTTQTLMSVLRLSACAAVRYAKVKINTIWKILFQFHHVNCYWTNHRGKPCAVCADIRRLLLPRAAGVSGVVKPFKQLRLRSHSNFNHVGVRLHLEGPIVSGKRISCLDLSSKTSGAKIWVMLIKTVKRLNSVYLYSPISQISLGVLYNLYT